MTTRIVSIALLGLACAWSLLAASTSRSVTVNCGHTGFRPMPMEGQAPERLDFRRPGKPRPEMWPPPPRDCPHTFTFRMDVIPEGPTAGERSGPDGQQLLLVHPGTGYSVRLYNPLPVRAGVTLSVDGLNTLTGQPGGPARGAKWMIAPHGTAVISGWQTGRRNARRFVFTAKRDSYARYRSDQLERDLTVNAGVIGAAYFWNSGELERALVHRYQPPGYWEAGGGVRLRSGKRPAAIGGVAPQEQSRGFDAGTGMGERLVNPVRSVWFDFDAGMYEPQGGLAIYYDFPGPSERTLGPFEDGGAFAPEMPGRTYITR